MIWFSVNFWSQILPGLYLSKIDRSGLSWGRGKFYCWQSASSGTWRQLKERVLLVSFIVIYTFYYRKYTSFCFQLELGICHELLGLSLTLLFLSSFHTPHFYLLMCWLNLLSSVWLGLCICYSIELKHQVSVWVASSLSISGISHKSLSLRDLPWLLYCKV